MANSEMVPFGKYKGQPVEALAADKSYCEWLVAQDWFRSRFAGLHTLIINNFGAPEETPEHNALQAKFLDKVWCLRFTLAREGLDHVRARLKAALAQLVKNRCDCRAMLQERLAREQARDIPAEIQARYAEELQRLECEVEGSHTDFQWHLGATQRLRALKVKDAASHYPYMAEGHQGNLRDLSQSLAKVEQTLQALSTYSVDRLKFQMSGLQFEVEGVDVVWRGWIGFVGCRYSGLPMWSLPRENDVYPARLLEDHQVWCTYDVRPRIECKPILGDDYPAVLRQMRASNCDTLVVGAYTGVGATLEQARCVFGDIKVLTVDDIEQQPTGLFVLAPEDEGVL
jgi:hypothetical protein